MFRHDYALKFTDEYLFVYDCETTGLNFASDKLIQVAGVLLKLDDGGKYNYYCHVDEYIHWPDLVLPDIIVKITGITDEHLSEYGKSPDLVRRKLKALFKGKQIRFIAHNVSFDRNFLNSFLGYTHISKSDTFCTLRFLSWKKRNEFLNEHVENYGGNISGYKANNLWIKGGEKPGKYRFFEKGELKLETLQKTFNLEHEVTHNALDDLIVLLNLLEYINNS
jgi:DNA polymerase III epsilon subunit-like protein